MVAYTQYHVADNNVRDVYAGPTTEPEKGQCFIKEAKGRVFVWCEDTNTAPKQWFELLEDENNEFKWQFIPPTHVPKIVQMYRLVNNG